MHSTKSNKWAIIHHDKSYASAFNPRKAFLFLNGVGVKVTTMNSAKPGKYWPNKLRVGGPLQKYQISVLGCRIRGFPLSAREAQFVSSHNWTGLSLTELLFHRGMHIRSKKLQIYFTGVFNYFTI